jgi:hypothetical protein
MPYTALQRLRRLNAEHYSEHVKLLDMFEKNVQLLRRRPRGEYTRAERKVLEATVKVIGSFLTLDSSFKKLRIIIQKQDRLIKKVLKVKSSAQ